MFSVFREEGSCLANFYSCLATQGSGSSDPKNGDAGAGPRESMIIHAFSYVTVGNRIGLKLWSYSVCFVWWVWVQDVQVNCWGEHVLRPLVFLDGRNKWFTKACPECATIRHSQPCKVHSDNRLDGGSDVGGHFFLLRKSSCLMTWYVRMYMEVPDEQQMDHLFFSCQQDAEF